MPLLRDQNFFGLCAYSFDPAIWCHYWAEV